MTEPSRPDRVAEDPPRRRPMLERIGLAAVALVLAGLFGGVAVAAWLGGELFLAVMGGIGCLMTLWVGVADAVPRLTVDRPATPRSYKSPTVRP